MYAPLFVIPTSQCVPSFPHAPDPTDSSLPPSFPAFELCPPPYGLFPLERSREDDVYMLASPQPAPEDPARPPVRDLWMMMVAGRYVAIVVAAAMYLVLVGGCLRLLARGLVE